MLRKPYKLLFTALSLVLIVNCAKKGTITGGEKDEKPPEFVKALPPNFFTNYNKKEIRIYFNEYIKLKDPQKQIIVSPPMDPSPTITPLGGASKFVKIKFTDTLLENTTYSINFGESIVDNNEGNPLPFFRYVFSTGNSLDSLSISGTVSDALEKKAESFITVVLYEIDEKYSDSLVYKSVPRYVSNTLDSTRFSLDNLKAGTYKLLALKDASNNYKYEPKQDKIGFYEEIVTLPADTAKRFNINIFKEAVKFKATKPKQVSKNSFIFGYEGEIDSMKIKLLSNTDVKLETRIVKDKEKDTLQYWFKPFFKADSLVFEVTNTNNYRDTLISRFKDQYKDSIKVTSNVGSILDFDKDFILTANTPLEAINESLIKLTDKDTVIVPFSVQLDKFKNEARFTFERTENNLYTVQVLPESIKDFLGNVNDTLNFGFKTKKISDYGKIFLTLQKVKKYPLVVQVLNEKGIVINEKITNKDEVIVFDNLNPNKYNIRVIFDSNKNGKWDSGNFLENKQPEKTSYFPDLIDVRANWELKQVFILE